MFPCVGLLARTIEIATDFVQDKFHRQVIKQNLRQYENKIVANFFEIVPVHVLLFFSFFLFRRPQMATVVDKHAWTTVQREDPNFWGRHYVTHVGRFLLQTHSELYFVNEPPPFRANSSNLKSHGMRWIRNPVESHMTSSKKLRDMHCRRRCRSDRG